MQTKHKVIFYPVGNGDTSQIILDNGQRILMDYRHQIKGENTSEPVIDLKSRLKKELDDADRDYFDVVAFTHADDDHICGSTDFFELEFANKYQGDGRIKISELWVPAAMLLEKTDNDHRSNEFVILRQEARHRLLEGKGIGTPSLFTRTANRSPSIITNLLTDFILNLTKNLGIKYSNS